MQLQELFSQALRHRNEHDCSAYPYEDYLKLIAAVNQYQAKQVLEIGTGMGFTSAAMALQSPDIRIDTIEKDPEHVQAARQFHFANGVKNQIAVLEGPAEQIMSSLAGPYDLIFFDGYQIHYEFLPHYARLLKPGGVLFLANNQLNSKTSDHFWDELKNSGNWQILEQFADTTIAQRR